jgi:hypothetical protein
MAAFDTIDHRRFDVPAIVTFGGIVAIEPEERASRRDWLLREGYTIDSIDCSHGFDRTVTALGEILRWEENFGYRMEEGARGLDALHDGFDFEIPEGGGRVLELVRPDLAWQADARWTAGLLDIAMEHTRFHLAQGRRFFTMLVLPPDSAFPEALPSWMAMAHPRSADP